VTVTLVLGGTRSGKSDFAERLTLRNEGAVLYIATGLSPAQAEGDGDMAARIARHQARRDPRFETVEAGPDLATALRDAPPRPALVDSLGAWVAARRHFADEKRMRPEIDDLLDALRERSASTVIVSDEVGLGVHPSSEIGRQFRDALGLVNQAVAAVAADAWLVVAGRGLALQREDGS
jgi:adenosyl cobinamide kinase/adenosyl cobinamide phosphate guanylyltransferase